MCRGRVLSDVDGEPERILGTVLDVTDARDQAQTQFVAVQRGAAIAAVAAEVANATGIAQLAEITLRGAEVLGAVSGGIAVVEADRSGALLYLGRRLIDAVRAETQEQVTGAGLPIELDDLLPTQFTARTGEAVLLPDAEEAAARFPAMAEVTGILGIRALASLPLLVEGRLLGSFVVYWTTDHAFDADELRLLEGLAAQIAVSISRLQADDARDSAVTAMTEANQRLELLAEAGRMLSSTLDIDEQLQRLAALVVPRLGDWCWIVTTDEHGRLQESASAHRDPGRSEQVADYVRMMLQAVTPDSATEGRLPHRTADGHPEPHARAHGAVARGPGGARGAAGAGAVVGRRRAADHPGADRRRAVPGQRRRARSAPGRGRGDRGGGGPPRRDVAAPRPALRPAAGARRRAAAQHAHRAATDPRLRDRGALRAGRRGRRDRRRLVRRLPAGRPAPPCWPSATSSGTTPAPLPPWGRSGACCAASATPAAGRRPRC